MQREGRRGGERAVRVDRRDDGVDVGGFGWGGPGGRGACAECCGRGGLRLGLRLRWGRGEEVWGREREGRCFGVEVADGRRGVEVGVWGAVRCGGLRVGGGRVAVLRALVVCVLAENVCLLEVARVKREGGVRCEEA